MQNEKYVHFKIEGKGRNLAEAWSNFIRDAMRTIPNDENKGILWRTLPEISSDRSFETAETLYKIYARATLYDGPDRMDPVYEVTLRSS